MIIAFHKPYGVLSQFNENPDKPGQKTLAAFDLPPEFTPVGRLDMDSEGLLLITDEKQLEADLLRPHKQHVRTYLVQVEGKPTLTDMRDIAAGGLEIRGHTTKPCFAQLVGGIPRRLGTREPAVDPISDKRSSWIMLRLKEGKNRQVRRMTAKIGYPTLRLIRTSIGEFDLGDLAPGKWVVLDDDDVEALKK
ncbi:MAG: 23S rRNA pseudouridine2457 synthase [Cryomorphaceae bacterium]|jgi:23S rRNA pseudouridine2457 synthase